MLERSIKKLSMNDYLVDRETLGQFVDALIAQKSQNQPTGNYDALREIMIQEADDRILDYLFRGLSRPQFDELNALLERDEEDPAAFETFFKNANIDLKQLITKALESYQTEFLGGQNA